MGKWFGARNDGNTINLKKVPIILVPGLMGSRLGLYGFTWDPDKVLGLDFLWQWNSASFKKKWAALYHRTPATVLDLKKNNGIGSVAQSFYGALLKALAKKEFYCAKTPVYAVGYDWRQGNEDSAAHLKKRIDEILLEEKAKRFILISHSMGGLVSRWMLKQHPEMQAKAIGVIHVVQPAAGASVLYRRLFTGQQDELDGDDIASRALNNIYSRTPAETAVLYASMPGPMQLLPTDYYNYNDKNFSWLQVETHEPWPQPQERTQGKSIFDRYLDTASPPGLASGHFTKDILHDALARAKKFHSDLGVWKLKDKTWAIFCSLLETDVAVKFECYNPVKPGRYEAPGGFVVVPVRESRGDGTVPANSASALFPGQAHDLTLDNVRNPQKRQFRVDFVEHSSVFKDDNVRNCVIELVEEAIRHSWSTP